MPDAVLVEAAEAVKDALNAAALSRSFAAVRAYMPSNDTEDLSALEVTVVMRDWTPKAVTRGATDNEYGIDVGVQQRLPEGVLSNDDVNAFCDPLMYFVQEIVDLFQRKPIPGYTTASCTAATNLPIYLPEHLREKKVFTSVVRLTVKKVRDL